MPAPTSSIVAGWADYNNEKSHTRLWVTDLTAANIVAQTTAINTLMNALDAITLGRLQTQTITLSNTIVSADPPTSPNAQRETKWLLRYHAISTSEKFVAEVPCADLTLLGFHIDMADMSGADFAALKSIWEQVVRDPNNNSLTILDSAQHVGRNL